jgi:hypothetical protein
MSNTSARKPGDYLLDRYMPNATPEKREEAREHLRQFARFLIRVHGRRIGDNPHREIRANKEDALDSGSPSQPV